MCWTCFTLGYFSFTNPTSISHPLPHLSLGGASATEIAEIWKEDTRARRNFKLYVVCRDRKEAELLRDLNDHVNFVNFGVTEETLEDHFLHEIVLVARPILERERNSLEARFVLDKNDLAELEDKILQHVSDTSGGTLLDNQDLVDVLQETKSTAEGLYKRLEEAEEQRAEVQKSRLLFLPLAHRCVSRLHDSP